MPEDDRDVKFGVTEKDRGQELNSCLNLYILPFRDAWRLMTRTRRAKPAAAAEPASPAQDSTPQPATQG